LDAPSEWRNLGAVGLVAVASPYLIVDHPPYQTPHSRQQMHRRGRQVFHKVTPATVSLFTYSYLYFTLQKLRNISLA